MSTKEQTARDRVGNAIAALLAVEGMLPDGDERKAVYGMRVGMQTMKDRLVKLATKGYTVDDSPETVARNRAAFGMK